MRGHAAASGARAPSDATTRERGGRATPLCAAAPLLLLAGSAPAFSLEPAGGLGLGASAAIFAVAAAAVWLAGTQLTRFVDEIAERRRLDRAFMGAVVLATATQLPEIVTNLTAAHRGDARLVLGGMFGGVSMQTAVIVIADAVALRCAITHLSHRPSNLVLASALIVLLSIVIGLTVTGDFTVFGRVGLGSTLLAGCYGFVLWIASSATEGGAWEPATTADGDDAVHDAADRSRVRSLSTTRLVYGAIAAAGVILVAGVALVITAEAIAARSGLGSSFIGVTLLASATSLPEVSTTLTAVRLGQHSMALADIFGSNLIMVGLLLPTDLVYAGGALLDEADPSARFALALGILLTAIYLIGLVLRQPRKLWGLGIDSWVVLTCYAVGVYLLYGLRQST